MKIGDLVKYRGKEFDSWLGVIILELPGHSEYKMVQWVNSENGRAERVNHKAKELWVINENR